MLAEILKFGSLNDQLIDLVCHNELIVRFEIAAGELLCHSV